MFQGSSEQLPRVAPSARRQGSLRPRARGPAPRPAPPRAPPRLHHRAHQSGPAGPTWAHPHPGRVRLTLACSLREKEAVAVSERRRRPEARLSLRYPRTRGRSLVLGRALRQPPGRRSSLVPLPRRGRGAGAGAGWLPAPRPAPRWRPLAGAAPAGCVDAPPSCRPSRGRRGSGHLPAPRPSGLLCGPCGSSRLLPAPLCPLPASCGSGSGLAAAGECW